MQETAQTRNRLSPADLAMLYGPAAVLALAFLWLFRDTLYGMAVRWEEPTFSHGWLVAPAAVVIAWFKREEWIHTPVRPSLGGLAIVVVGLLTMLGAAYASINFVPYVSMLIVLGGIIVFLGGWLWLKRLAFPYAFLYFMVPWPDFLLERLSVPMQQMTSIYAGMLAKLIMKVQQEGVSLHILNPDGSHFASFEVAVACSGLRSLVALLALAAGFAYFTPAPMWKRWGLFLAGIPMAFAANVIRVFLILCVGRWISPDLASGMFHDYSAPALFFINTLGLMAMRNAILREPKLEPAMAGASTADDTLAMEPALTPGRPRAAAKEDEDDAF